MPVWLKLPILILTFLFNIFGILSTGRLFYAQSFGQQIKTVDAWQNSPINCAGNLLNFMKRWRSLFITLYEK